MAMNEDTKRKIRKSITHSNIIATIHGATDNEIKYWRSQDWINKVGNRYVLTTKGLNALNKPPSRKSDEYTDEQRYQDEYNYNHGITDIYGRKIKRSKSRR